MRMRTHGCHRIVTEISKTANFQARFFYNMFLYWLATYSLLASFFKWVKETNKTTNLECRFFYNSFLY